MNENELNISKKAVEFARSNKKNITKTLTKLEKFPPDEIPVSVFMAGSPGAGKTESATNLIAKFSRDKDILHIDSDNLRIEFEDYNGKNSSLFQGATSILVDKMQDFAIRQRQSYIFDGTLANLKRANREYLQKLKT